ncbi:MAG TPA: c-type cytochrome [Terriglobales bacterium]|nr:c-type cytochrome [Terriglobales bacterium]
MSGNLVVARGSMADNPGAESKPIASGRRIFASMCASCHGLDGKGGERAPDIARTPAVQRLSDEKLRRLVEEGVPGTGMPAFHSLGSSGTKAVVRYLRVLQGRGRLSALPGDVERGRALFFGRAGCSACHMVGGEGGFVASDLSAYASGHSVREIKDAMIHTARNSEASSRHAVVITREGERYDGIVRNEDNFSIQLQALDGTFQFFMKRDVSQVLRRPPVMPSGNAIALTGAELDDVTKFLVSAAKTGNQETASDAE